MGLNINFDHWDSTVQPMIPGMDGVQGVEKEGGLVTRLEMHYLLRGIEDLGLAQQVLGRISRGEGKEKVFPKGPSRLRVTKLKDLKL